MLKRRGRKQKADLEFLGKRKVNNEEEKTGVQGGVPLAPQKQTCQKLRKIQVKGLAIKGKRKETNDEKSEKTGVQGGVPVAC